ncbi:MAG TPA: acyl-CoA dehydrogenase, partial [Rhizobiales bacterium]|nr:acyl-CoA dehydrogenase [Hyphomicrobiales bacterium]
MSEQIELDSGTIALDNLVELTKSAVRDVDNLFAKAKACLAERVWDYDDDRFSTKLLEREQHAVHGLAWFATYAETLRQMSIYAEKSSQEGRFGEIEKLLTQIIFGEYLNQIAGGIPMSQSEFVRPAALDLRRSDTDVLFEGLTGELTRFGNSINTRARLAELLSDASGNLTCGDCGLDDTMMQMRQEMRRFVNDKVTPYAHQWHLANDYVPMEIIEELAELGVFSLTLPEEYGGMEMGKEAMCVVSEELSRGYIAVGSLGTRAEIAAELILQGGTEDQKHYWLPKIGAGEILPTAVFTEPNTGSDLASLRTRAVKEGDSYVVTGNKTWITHPVRADLMTLLVRTNPDEKGYKGLSMLLAEKPRGSDEEPFPADGMSGSEIEVLGYRGMKEFEIGFDGFKVNAKNLLGGTEGNGFKQLMQTFESARIQTAGRAIGVAQNAFELGLTYASDRIQFGKPIISFPRISDKLAMMAAEIMATRQLVYFAAREKDAGRRCDLEAGMAKLLAARVAWSAADNALQIHGGNGFALE